RAKGQSTRAATGPTAAWAVVLAVTYPECQCADTGTLPTSGLPRKVVLMVSERSLAVLRVIVQDYVSSSEPVGSKSIVERHSFGVSSATIRNDMAQLRSEERRVGQDRGDRRT